MHLTQMGRISMIDIASTSGGCKKTELGHNSNAKWQTAYGVDVQLPPIRTSYIPSKNYNGETMIPIVALAQKKMRGKVIHKAKRWGNHK